MPRGSLHRPPRSTIDLTSVLGAGTSDLPLPAHSHIVATANSNQAEWWNVDVVGVKSLKAWDKIVHSEERPGAAVPAADRGSKDVTGNITTNLFLYFSVL